MWTYFQWVASDLPVSKQWLIQIPAFSQNVFCLCPPDSTPCWISVTAHTCCLAKHFLFLLSVWCVFRAVLYLYMRWILPSLLFQVHKMIAEFKLIPGLNNLFDKLIWRKHSASALVLHGHNQNCDCSPVSNFLSSVQILMLLIIQFWDIVLSKAMLV